MRIPTLVLLLSGLLTVPASAQDGPAIMRRMVAAYARLKGYSYTLSATMITRRADQDAASGTRTIVRFSRPNRLYLRSVNPDEEVGTFTAASDGKQQVIHVAKYNAYQRQPAPADAAGLLRSLQPYGVGVVVNLPLQLLRGPLPAGRITGPTRGRDVLVNGATCYTVSGTYRHPNLVNGAQGRATLSISRRDNLLRRVVVRYSRIPTVYEDVVAEAGGMRLKKVRGFMSVTLSEMVLSPEANGTFAADAFTFKLPAGATETPPLKPGQVMR